MKRLLVFLVLPFLGVPCGAEILLNLDFESDTAAAQPAGDGVRPSGSNISETTALPAAPGPDGPIGVIVGPYPGAPVTNSVGSGQYFRYYDHDSDSGAGLELNFVDSAEAGRDAIRFAFEFAATQPNLGGTVQMRISVGAYHDQNKINLGSSSQRPFLFDVRTDGTLKLSVEEEGGPVETTFDTATAHQVELYVNDAQETTHIITGPDEEEHALLPNTVTLFLDGTLLGQALLDNTLNYRLIGGGLGRIGFFSTTANTGIDFIFDNIVVEAIDNPGSGGGDPDAWRGEGAVVYTEDFESATAGDRPTGERVRPSSNVGMTESYPLTAASGGPLGLVIGPYADSPVTNVVGSGQYLRAYDADSSSGVSLERNFVANEGAQLSTLRASVNFASSAAELDATAQMRISLGQFSDSASSTLGASSGRPFLLFLRNDGTLTLDMSDGENDASASFDRTSDHEVVLYINDEEDRTHTVTGPDGASHTLYTNSVSVFLDGVLVKQAPLDFELNYNLTEGNFGRFGIFTLSGEAGADIIFDNFEMAEIDNPDATLVPWPGNDGGNNGGDAPEDTSADYDLVLLDETFDYPEGELGAVSFFTVADGSPQLRVENGSLVYDYSARAAGELSGHYKNVFYGGNTVQTDTRADNAYGPGVYVRFRPRFETPPTATEGTPFLALNNPDLPAFVTARVWIRATAEGAINLGLSPDGNAATVAWAEDNFSTGDAPLVVMKYNNETNDSRLWINPATSADEPDAIAFANNDVGYYGVNAVSLLIDNTSDYGVFTLDDLRVAGSFALALDFTPVERPDVLLTESTGSYTAESRSYRTIFGGNMAFESLLVGGEAFLLEGAAGGAGWAVTQSGTIGNSRRYEPAHVNIQTNWQLATASFDNEQFSLNLQNNDEDNAASYRFVFDGAIVGKIVTANGTETLLPLVAPVTSSEIALLSEYNAVNLIGVDEAHMESSNLIVEVQLAPRETRTVTLIMGYNGLESPQNYQVFQRQTETEGTAFFSGRVFGDVDSVAVSFSGEAPIAGSLPSAPQTLDVDSTSGRFAGSIDLPAGGWYEATISYRQGNAEVASKSIAHLGIGEVFIGAGQSNSTNSGTEPLEPTSELVVSYSGGHWQPGLDPQPGSHDTSSKGSYYPALGDELAAKYGVPIAFVSTGQGASTIAFWQPDYTYDYTEFGNYARHNGLYDWTLNRVRQLGPNGFRGILWHQGESDSSHTPGVTRTTEEDYYQGLKRLILSLRADAGWDVPWYVARASVWPLPEENPDGDPNIHNAQMRIWEDLIAFEGANTDSLADLSYHQPDGSRVHFNPNGLRAHAHLWFERISEILDPLFDQGALGVTVSEEFGTATQALGDDTFATYGFGTFFGGYLPWFHSPHFGWSYLYDAGSPHTGMWFYSLGQIGRNGWVWTRKDMIPYFYSDVDGDWIYFIFGQNGGADWIYRFAEATFEEVTP